MQSPKHGARHSSEEARRSRPPIWIIIIDFIEKGKLDALLELGGMAGFYPGPRSPEKGPDPGFRSILLRGHTKRLDLFRLPSKFKWFEQVKAWYWCSCAGNRMQGSQEKSLSTRCRVK